MSDADIKQAFDEICATITKRCKTAGLSMSEARVSNSDKLKFHALYMQSRKGNCRQFGGERPNPLDVVEFFKWEAWNKLGSMSKTDAMCAYIELYNECNK